MFADVIARNAAIQRPGFPAENEGDLVSTSLPFIPRFDTSLILLPQVFIAYPGNREDFGFYDLHDLITWLPGGICMIYIGYSIHNIPVTVDTGST